MKHPNDSIVTPAHELHGEANAQTWRGLPSRCGAGRYVDVAEVCYGSAVDAAHESAQICHLTQVLRLLNQDMP